MVPSSAIQQGPSASSAEVDVSLKHAVFDRFVHGLLIVDARGRVLMGNRSAALILRAIGVPGSRVTCCELLGCEGPEDCPTSLALAGDGQSDEVRRDLRHGPRSETIWVSAFALAEGPARVLLQLRRGDPHDRRRREDRGWRAQALLRITTLGHTALVCGERAIEGGWLDQRAGDLLRYLIVHRERAVSADEIGESLWRGAGFEVARNVRTTVHRLRNELEPARERARSNAYLLTRGGSYRLNQEMVQIDADEFEAGLRGARELVGKQPEVAAERLEQALALYGGELFADCPFAEWALLERGRLHQLACDALDRLAQLRCEEGQPELARQALERLAELQPLDERVCRQLVSLDIADGRHGDAKRRHDRLARMMRESLGYPPRFTLSELAPGNADEIRK